MRLVKRVILGLAFGLAALCDPIVVFNTGESGGGTALAIGQADSHYSLVSAPTGVPLTAIATSPNGAWAGNTATADWISPSSSGYDGWAPGLYDYQTTFDLTGLDASTAQLSGLWTADNDASIYLNGVFTGVSTSFTGFESLNAFSITSGFQAGVNTLDLMVDNGQISPGDNTPNPTGVLLEVSGTAARAVPEPSSLILLSLLLLGSVAIPRLRQAYRPPTTERGPHPGAGFPEGPTLPEALRGREPCSCSLWEVVASPQNLPDVIVGETINLGACAADRLFAVSGNAVSAGPDFG